MTPRFRPFFLFKNAEEEERREGRRPPTANVRRVKKNTSSEVMGLGRFFFLLLPWFSPFFPPGPDGNGTKKRTRIRDVHGYLPRLIFGFCWFLAQAQMARYKSAISRWYETLEYSTPIHWDVTSQLTFSFFGGRVGEESTCCTLPDTKRHVRSIFNQT